MPFIVRIELIGHRGVPEGAPILYEAETELEAMALAAYDIDAGIVRLQSIATIFDTDGKLVLTYTGRTQVDRP